MKGLNFHFLAVLLLGVSALSGQTIDPKQLEPSLSDLSVPPNDRVLDFGEIFSDNAARVKLSQRLEELNERYQFSVYYIAYSGIIGSNVDEKAAEFRDLWLGTEKEGLIFVCDTDMKSIAYGLTRVDGLPLDGSSHKWKIPDHEALNLGDALFRIDATEMSEERYLTTVGLRLVDELEQKLEPPQNKGGDGRGGILGSVIVAAGLIGFGVWWARRNAVVTAERIEGTLFPSMEIPNRLGAHFGGGSVCEISFQPPSSSSSS